VLQAFREPVVAPRDVRQSTTSANYQRPEGGGTSRLVVGGGQASFTLVRTAQELRVVVHIRFVTGRLDANRHVVTAQPLQQYRNDAKLREWHNGIVRYWSDKLVATNGRSRLNVTFEPYVDRSWDASPDFTVTVVPEEFRSDVTDWSEAYGGVVAAHEFGHMLGNPDEYALPAKRSDIPIAELPNEASRTRSNIADLPAGTRTDPDPAGGRSVHGLMGWYDKSTDIEPRHGWLVLDTLNDGMLISGEPKFTLEKR